MHPAPSIIVFTTFSGLGFGLMAMLGLGAGKGEGWIAATFCALALGLAGAGLLASLFHLGQPSRFLKAFSQWRSSWLSREALLAVATLLVFGAYAALWSLAGLRLAALGLLAAALAVATVFATSMIYAQMKSVPRWRSPLTPAIFLFASLSGGALLAGETRPATVLLAALGVLQLADWFRGDGRFAAAGSTHRVFPHAERICHGRRRLRRDLLGVDEDAARLQCAVNRAEQRLLGLVRKVMDGERRDEGVLLLRQSNRGIVGRDAGEVVRHRP